MIAARVKVLDFGLAKAYAGESAAGPSSADLSESTLARSGTLAGVILGTAAYMSPEQARGKAVDGRADIWAFGVVLFEMLTGRRLFKGETVSDVLASVMKDEPAAPRGPGREAVGADRVLRGPGAGGPLNRPSGAAAEAAASVVSPRVCNLREWS